VAQDVTEVIVGFLKLHGICAMALLDHFEFEMVLSELHKLQLVLQNLKECPLLANENLFIKCRNLSVSLRKSENSLVLLILDDFSFEVLVGQQDDAVLRLADLRKQFAFEHLKHFKVKYGLESIILAEVANQRGLIDEAKRLIEVIVSQRGKTTENEKL
jgi:hypothetical protein